MDQDEDFWIEHIDDPRILAILLGAKRGDRSVAPALRVALEDAYALFSNTSSVYEKSAQQAGQSQEALMAAMQKNMAPMTHFEELVGAAILMPDASLEPVLKNLSKAINEEGVREALARVRAEAAKDAGGPRIKNLAVAGTTPAPESPSLAKMIAASDYNGILDAVTEAPISDLLAGIAEAIRLDQGYLCESLVGSCHRYPETEVLFVVRPWLTHADPCRREAVMMALGREGDEDAAPDRRVMEVLFRALEDDAPSVVVAAVSAIGERTARAFTPTDLDKLRLYCERHPSVDVRGAYSDVFFSPYVGHEHAQGAVDAWCAMSRDRDWRIRSNACGRLSLCFCDPDEHAQFAAQIKVTLNLTKSDKSASVRFESLSGLARLGESHIEQIQRELVMLADRLENTELASRTEDADDGLGLVNELVQTPNQRYVPALERIVARLRAADHVVDSFEDLLQECHKAPRESFLGSFFR